MSGADREFITPLPWITTFNMLQIMLVIQPPWLPKKDSNINTSKFISKLMKLRKKLPDTEVKKLRQYS